MEVTRVLHMNGGDGETSYAKYSNLQNKIIKMARPILEEAVTEMLSNIKPAPMIINIADLGCSSGPNSLLAVSEIIDFIEAKCNDLGLQARELSIFLNDLSFNDFNYVFRLLPEFYNQLKKEKGTSFGPCFVSATPGSFYGRLFPSMSTLLLVCTGSPRLAC
uniref:Jasmonate O-methyltransferase n=1 Tax=Rhizophora mucronata TaxID=61149 RepID=A0A2P2PIA4_RHIMU